MSVNFDQTWYSVNPYKVQQSQVKYFLSIWFCISLNIIRINFKLQVIYISDIYTFVLHLKWYWRQTYLSMKINIFLTNEKNICQWKQYHSLIISHIIVDEGKPGELITLNSYKYWIGMCYTIVKGVPKLFQYLIWWSAQNFQSIT